MAQPVAGSEAENRPDRPERRGSGTGVILLLFLLAGVLGVIAFWRFTKSDRFIQASLAQVRKRAPELTVDQCVDEVIAWARGCQAMKGLCDGTIPRITEVCLQGRDRQAYCDGLGDRYRATSFGVPECRARVAAGDGRGKKVCAISYRAVAQHCERLRLLRERGQGERGAR